MKSSAPKCKDCSALSRMLGVVLRGRREGSKLSQAGLAAKSGLARSEVQRVECGQRDMRVGTLERFCKGLGVSVPEVAAEAQRRLHEQALLGV